MRSKSLDFRAHQPRLYNQELIMKIQADRQVSPLKEQKDSQEEFQQTERHILNKLIIADNFSQQIPKSANWEIANFYSHSSEGLSEVRGNFRPFEIQPNNFGIPIQNLVLRSKPTISLKSIACEINLTFRLIGDSAFFIITRGSGVKDPDAMICKFKKDSDSQRVFVIFGANIGPGNEFKFFKKQEIPELEEINEIQDYVDIKVDLIDNGDDKVFITAVTTNKRCMNSCCNKFIPCFRDTHIMLAGNGDGVLLKNVAVKQVERVESNHQQPVHHECCEIF
ncbi:unnamed protein product [Blepharisma stoltei]|uniref:Uncharacterized protein n=1 Tax=Blepharisma stoltei TaxID=1481888 RepID=A0AAU9JR57_9CILI|nr:unnamed protein product [Blepharisma stoltei]